MRKFLRCAARLAMGAALAFALAGVLAACTTIGTGTGSFESDNQPVSFAWTSKDGGTSGTMSATLADGKVFSGPYLQVTSTARSDNFAPLWSGWDYGWPDLRWGGAGMPFTSFQTVYSGRVMANLQATDGKRMRCHFQLNNPSAGMEGGGQGQCQVQGGATVDAVFPAA
jgi:hypothetical protein